MEELKDELGKLRNEVRVGFIEVDNRFQAVNDRLDIVNQGLKKVITDLNVTNQEVKKAQSQMAKVATLVDQGFEVIQTHVDQKLKQHELRLTNVEERLKRAGL